MAKKQATDQAAEKEVKVRPYLVTEFPGEGRQQIETIVIARSESAALRHCVEPRFTTRLLKATEVAEMAAGGAVIQRAKEQA